MGQKLLAVSPTYPIVDGSLNFVEFRFKLDQDWENIDNKIIQFIQNDRGYDVPLSEENTVYLPNSITEGYCEMVMRGSEVVDGELKVATSDALKFKIVGDRYIDDPSEVSVSLKFYDELIETIETIVSGDTIITDGSVTTEKISEGAVTLGKLSTDVLELIDDKQDSLTPDQLEAINSGITDTLVDDISDNTTARHTHTNKTVLDGISSSDISNWNNKVDKDGTKVLSDNNFTTAEKEKLAGLENYDDTELKSQIDEKVDLSDIQAYGMLNKKEILLTDTSISSAGGKALSSKYLSAVNNGKITNISGRNIAIFNADSHIIYSYILNTPTAVCYNIGFYSAGLIKDDGTVDEANSANYFISGFLNDEDARGKLIEYNNITIPDEAKYIVFAYLRSDADKKLFKMNAFDAEELVKDESYVHTDNNYTNADKAKVDEIPEKKVKLIYNNGQLEFLSKIKKDSNNDDVYISLMAYMPNSNSSHSNQSYSFGTIASKYSDGTVYQPIKTANDDVAPLHFNDDYRGAGHGDSGGYKYTFAYINDAPVFTESNIGEIWQSYSSDGSLIKLLIYKVENDDVNKKSIVFVFEPASDDISALNSYERAIIYRASGIPSLTWQKEDGTAYTADEEGSRVRTQILPSVQNVEVKIFSENSEITENGVYESNYFDVVEKYEILYIPDMINALKNNVGQNTNESYYKGNYDKYCTITNTYRYCERGILTIFQAVEWDKEVNLNWVAFIQSATMSKTNHFRIPNTTFKINSENIRYDQTGYISNKYVFARNGDDIPENVDNCWLDDSNPPSRFYQVVEPNYGDFSFCMGYCSDYGTERKFPDGTLTKICGSLFYKTQKFYPYYLSGSAIAEDGKTNDPTISGKITNKFTSAVSYRIPINNSYDEDMLVCWYYVNDDIYLVLDCQKEVNKFVKLPPEFIGRKISFVEKYGKIECDYKFVTNDGIKIKVGIPDGDTVGYGSAVIKLSK